MSRQARSRPEVTGDSRLARARDRFRPGEPVEPGQVRDTILASWRRSREWHVAADRIDLSYARDPDLDTPLTRTALGVALNAKVCTAILPCRTKNVSVPSSYVL